MSSSNRRGADLEEITAEFDRTVPLDSSTVRRWMMTDDDEAAGALMALLADPRHDSRIRPPLPPEEYFEFAQRYYERTMLGNSEGEWVGSATDAGYDFARWFKRLWDDPNIPNSAAYNLKKSLERSYLAAPETVRKNITNSALEQLFYDSEILNYFADWKEDPLLQSAYEEARGSAMARNRIRQKGEASD